jgi:hypothetical protein
MERGSRRRLNHIHRETRMATAQPIYDDWQNPDDHRFRGANPHFPDSRIQEELDFLDTAP